jgi:hypothetical protein
MTLGLQNHITQTHTTSHGWHRSHHAGWLEWKVVTLAVGPWAGRRPLLQILVMVSFTVLLKKHTVSTAVGIFETEAVSECFDSSSQ